MDWFATTLTAGSTYVIPLQGTSGQTTNLHDGRVSVYDATSSLIAWTEDTTGNGAQVTLTPTTTGTYYIAAAGMSTDTGGYTLDLIQQASITDDYAASTATTGTVAVGGSTAGTLESGGDADWFGVSLTAGISYNLTVGGQASGLGTLTDPYLRLYNAAGTLLNQVDNSTVDGRYGPDPTLLFTPGTSGVYYLSASGASASLSGTYQVAVASLGTNGGDDHPNAPGNPNWTPVSVAIGSNRSGRLDGHRCGRLRGYANDGNDL